MTFADLVPYAIAAIVGIALSALFSGNETGLYTINRVRLALRADHGDPRARRIRWFLTHPNRMLSTLLIGNNIANYLASFGLAAIVDAAGFTPAGAIALNAAVLIPLLFVFGEILPKDLFRTHTDHWTYACSGLLVFVERVLTFTGLNPVVQAFGGALGRILGADTSSTRSARQRMSQLIKEGLGAGVLTSAQTTLADRAIVLREHRVRTEMVPWPRVQWLRLDASPQQRERILRTRNVTRLPVVDTRQAGGRVVGIIRLVDAVLQPDRPTEQLITPPIELAPHTPVREALRLLRGERQAMAIVVDPRTKRPLGVVTLKDLVEPLVGELAAW